MPAKGSTKVVKPSKAEKVSKPAEGSINRGRGRPVGGGKPAKPTKPMSTIFVKEERLQRFIYKIMKNVDPELGLSKKAMTAMNSIILDLYRKISREAATLSRSKGNTLLRAQDVQTAAKLSIPGEIRKHALSEGARALTMYRSSMAKN